MRLAGLFCRLARWLLPVLLAAAPIAALLAQTSEEPLELAPPGTVRVELEPASVTIGDAIRATVTLVWDGEEPAAAPRFPAWQDSWGGAEIVRVGAVEAFVDQSGRRIYTQEMALAAFATGEITLPVMTVAVPLADETVEVPTPEGLAIEVRSLLPEIEEGQELPAPRQAAAPLGLPPRTLFLITTLALLALLFFAAFRFFRRLQAAAVASGAVRPWVAPLDELIERLARLDPAAAEPAHTGLSLALREFFGRRLSFPARESTTSEIQRQLRQAPIPPAAAQRAVQLLRACDQVKFARLEVAAAVTGQRLEQARQLAREVEVALRPAPSEEAGEASPAAALSASLLA